MLICKNFDFNIFKTPELKLLIIEQLFDSLVGGNLMPKEEMVQVKLSGEEVKIPIGE
ncbi:hypothetical protein [Rickettsia bellii]|nr:hypothetical protein [Rickettsia bellii]ABV79690.1 hypothetical protein A1I_06900 [Rickettsia bellii OSU 85-389]KJV89108.1 hypothetical protein RBEAN4_0075 [Rickettsia bellii str. RML An4]